MYFPSVILILTLLGSVSLHLTEIDFNRIRQLPNEFSPTYNSNNRRSIAHNLYSKKNYDHYKNYDLHSQKQTMENEVIQTHQPREDPRLFYQTDSYLREVQDHNHEVTYIYPGREVINAEEEYIRPRRLRKMVKSLTLNSDDRSLCMQCPHDRTLIAKAGLDKVVLQSPSLLSCNGRTASREIRFVTMYGPNFGALLHQGSYVIVGKIMYNRQVLQMCKMQVHVILQSSRKCPLPNSLQAHCNNDYECSFTCQDPNLDLQGPRALVCDKDLNWEGNLPICKGRKWCVPQEPPEHGRISCKGISADNGPGLSEGSRCRVRCRLGWKAKNTVAVCRRGSWNHELACQPRQKNTV
ncbi:uncharacterized protein LOC123716376 [Pieris brassicae]|uniref:uncharacterized protein LOC123716376 n=1 Tax=Pieris brassicae TaxID=7116 RepID=UPI001E65E98A|nr:uncharacterized protein LOC123716376 [Pieris brassicae]